MKRILTKLKLLTSPIWETARPCLGTMACSSATTNPTVGGGGREGVTERQASSSSGRWREPAAA
ncbi:hypothetical protein EJB05_47214 [Eragrostis curvula]|uniref:Uncharacterized protein n=1 Tax=Eragrostis curvula TaxID=38414 RepID=A0A5J9T9B4_9POAL|nr:hypothetical protein EJB05_47214 [Eragrostis curvula]